MTAIAPSVSGLFGVRRAPGAPARRLVTAVVQLAVIAATTTATCALSAADDSGGPAFSVASGEIVTTREQPIVHLTFRQVERLDFRVYRVKDFAAFFAGLRDPHVLGSPEPVVAQEPTWIERIAAWKARRRAALRDFARRQVSHTYRAQRRRSADRSAMTRRRTVGFTQFAQAPLLNAAQVVSSWRELLPRVRDVEGRRIPLDLPGAGIYVVEAVHDHLRAYTVVVVSDLGLLTKTAPGQLLAFVARRDTGAPMGNCRILALAARERVAEGATGGDGVFVATLPAQSADSLVTLATCGAETVVADPGAWNLRGTTRELAAYVYTDRPVYRPGHTVNARAVLRWRDAGLLRPFDAPSVEVLVTDPDGKVLLRQQRPVGPFGTVAASMALPAASALGTYTLQVNSGDRQASGSFEVQEYRKPEFEVAVSTPERFVVQGHRARVTIRARYYFGQPVAGGSVQYVVYRSGYYSPYRWTDAPEDAYAGYAGYYGDQVSDARTTLDARGEATVDVPVPVDEGAEDLRLKIEARVTDASGREVSGSTTVHGTWGPFILAPELDRYLFAPGATARLTVRAVDYQGRPQGGLPVSIVLERLEHLAYPDPPRATSVLGTSARTQADGRLEWRFTVPGGAGDYRIRVSTPSSGRAVTAQIGLWVPGGRDSGDDVERTLELVLDRPSYAPGDVARVMVRGEPVDGPVLITKERELVSYHRVGAVQAGDAFEVPIADDDVGDTWVNVAALKDGRLFRAERRVPVPADRERLEVTVTPLSPVARPRDPGVFALRVTDASGAPVRAEVSVGVVDEALYGVRPDTTPDPVRHFHRREFSRVATQFSRDYGFVGYSGTERLLLAQRRRPFTLADFKTDRPQRPPIRREFPDAIHWVADLVTAADGTATVRVRYPDALTTWRLTARAVTAGTQAGSAIARTTVTKDLILRLATPKFLAERDTLHVPAIVNNYLPEAQEVAVSVTASGLTPIAPPQPLPVAAPLLVGTGRDARRFYSFRADTPGSATLTGTARAAADEDALATTIPVLPYGSRQERGTSGAVRGEGEQRTTIEIPEASNPGARTISVSLAPSLAGSLLGALDYLTEYPYGCTEQTLSSFLPNLLVVRALAELGLAPTERLQSVDRTTRAGLARLLDHQHEDGGWGWWKTDQNHPFMTAYALHGLLEAQRAGVRVDRGRMVRAAAATARLHAEYPRAVPDLKAYLTWVLTAAETRGIDVAAETGWSSVAARDALYAARERTSDYGRALLVLALRAASDPRAEGTARELLARAQRQGDLAWWRSDSDPLLGDQVDTSVEATAMAVKALAPSHPDDPVLDGAVRWLVASRGGGYYWATTKQTAMALYGLLEYLAARRERPGRFAVDVVVNGAVAGTRTFAQEDWTRATPVLVTAPGRAGRNEVTVVTRGPGTVYWSATARYFDVAESFTQQGSRRLALTRHYSVLSPVTIDGRIRYRETPFTGRARTGDLLLVRLVAAGSRDWRYLVLEDPLAAGTEPVVDQDAYDLERPVDWWWGSAREYRDDRTVFFQRDFDAGRYEFAYIVRVVTPGEFRAMPARIAPMYVPGVGATSTSQVVAIARPDDTAAGGGGDGAP